MRKKERVLRLPKRSTVRGVYFGNFERLARIKSKFGRSKEAIVDQEELGIQYNLSKETRLGVLSSHLIMSNYCVNCCNSSIMILCHLFFLDFISFWNFSRNCLADDELPLGDSSFFYMTLGSWRRTAWRYNLDRQTTHTCNSVFGFLMNDLAVMNTRQAMRAKIDSILMVCVF